jgi:DNA (cytosine-5)-methyltransferase 1
LIPNHSSAKLSELDMRIVLSVPPGGNWKDIPATIPSKRLETIRESYRLGLGSRSTYYGRLRGDRPSYTINTYFTRPGNGCHIHYDVAGGQHRVLSYREAARLQSFPDSFEFVGSARSVAVQIGNAVPPLLAFQIARMIPSKGMFVELFAGAGGMGLGFKWADWVPVLATDIDASVLKTHSHNIGTPTVLGDIRDATIFETIVRMIRDARKRSPNLPLWILGGPPCQGFSTAGKARTMRDERNHLFSDYKKLVDKVHPDGFVFENVSGLLSMNEGRVYRDVRDALSSGIKHVSAWVLSAEKFAIPQRRTRVILVGSRGPMIHPPAEITAFNGDADLFGARAAAITVEQAIGDLPELQQGENGSGKRYRHRPRSLYQKLMRGTIDPETYIAKVASHQAIPSSRM